LHYTLNFFIFTNTITLSQIGWEKFQPLKVLQHIIKKEKESPKNY